MEDHLQMLEYRSVVVSTPASFAGSIGARWSAILDEVLSGISHTPEKIFGP